MSRVSYSMMNPGGAALMTAAVREALCGLAADVARDAGISHEDILEATLVGNPIMHHLLLGIDPVELGGAPFALAVDHSLTLRANVIDLKLNRNARIYVLPCIAGHVGADAAGMVLAERPDLDAEMTLLVDVGTNAEIVLGNNRRLLACSSPTGPAFEGAQISCGQRAAPGAIERVRIDRETLEPRFKVIGSDLWSDDPAFNEATAATGITGVCGSGIIEVIAEMYLAGIINQDGVLDGRLSSRSPRIVANGRTFRVPAASRRGGNENQPDRCARHPAGEGRAVRGSRAPHGAAGHRSGRSHSPRGRLRQPYRRQVRDHPRDDSRLATLPRCAPPGMPRVPARASRCWIPRRAASSKRWSGASRRWKTAIEPRFQHHFVEAMAIPHKTADYANLRKVVDLPAPKESTSQAETRGRRPRRAEKSNTD